MESFFEVVIDYFVIFLGVTIYIVCLITPLLSLGLTITKEYQTDSGIMRIWMNLRSQRINWPSTTMAEKKGCLGCGTSARGLVVGRMPAAVAAKSSLAFLCQLYPKQAETGCSSHPKKS